METTDILPCLFIPDDSAKKEPVEERTIFFPPGTTFDDVVCKLLKCPRRAADIIYSEYLDAVYDGKGDLFPPKKEFRMYEAYMDDNGNSTRPYSTCAANLLLRPKSHGPMIIVKMMCIMDPKTGQVLPTRFEPLPASELESEEFRAKRKKYDEKETVCRQEVLEEFQRAGGIVVSL